MERFCPHCGKAADNHTHYCDGCGGPIDITPPQPRYTTLAGMPPPPYFPPAGSEPTTFDPFSPIPPRQFDTRVPGRGLGITSMVMSIAGTFLSLIFSLASVGQMHSWQFRQSWNSPWYQNEPCLAPELISIVLVFGLIPLLALLFGVISKKRGYRCGISTAGLIIGSIGIAICTIASLYLSQFL